MKKVAFEQNELMVMAMFPGSDKKQAIAKMEEVVPYIQDDEEVYPLVIGTIEKVKRIRDADYLKIDLARYQQEPEDVDEE